MFSEESNRYKWNKNEMKILSLYITFIKICSCGNCEIMPTITESLSCCEIEIIVKKGKKELT